MYVVGYCRGRGGRATQQDWLSDSGAAVRGRGKAAVGRAPSPRRCPLPDVPNTACLSPIISGGRRPTPQGGPRPRPLDRTASLYSIQYYTTVRVLFSTSLLSSTNYSHFTLQYDLIYFIIMYSIYYTSGWMRFVWDVYYNVVIVDEG